MNNLYVWAMSRFKWLKNANNFDVTSIMKRVDIGYILKVHLEYPDELQHVKHNDYALAPEKLAIPYDMLSDYCKKLLTNMK